MKQKLLIFGSILLLVLLLAGLNAASYVQTEKEPDTEASASRSTFNSGATGTMAFYTLLEESGRSVIRWQTPFSALGTEQKDLPSTFVLIGPFRRDITDAEAAELLRWVSNGGRLVLIDRHPPSELTVTTAPWTISLSPTNVTDIYTANPADFKQMTEGTPAVRPVLPSIFTAAVNAVQPSRFASNAVFSRLADAEAHSSDIVEDSAAAEVASASAPAVHFADSERNILIDAPFGKGTIVFLTDPYIVSNGGVLYADNAQMAANIVSNGGRIAFDEYHHGFGAGDNRFLDYFDGTPAAAIFLQCILIVGLVLVSRSRRFARPLPEFEPDRLSKLEYVAAMAELQRRTKAYDLAVENIYSDFRRRAARLFGVDNFSTKHTELAALIAERVKGDKNAIAELLFECEEMIRGEPVSRKAAVRVAGQVRELERRLGLVRTGVQTTLR